MIEMLYRVLQMRTRNFRMTSDTYDFYNDLYLGLNGPGICGTTDPNAVNQFHFVTVWMLNSLNYVLGAEQWLTIPLPC